MRLQVVQQVPEVGEVVEGGIAFGIGDEDGEDTAIVVGLHDVAVVAEEGEFLAGGKLGLDYGFKVAHLVLLYEFGLWDGRRRRPRSSSRVLM